MAESTGVSDLKGLAGLGASIFGSGGSASGTSTTRGTTSESGFERLKVDQAGINQIIQDVLGGAGGLADIFAGEQTSGIFNSSVAAQASGDLAAKLVGEIAKLTAEKQTGSRSTIDSTTATESEEETEGLLESIFGGLFSGGGSGSKGQTASTGTVASTPSVFGGATTTSGAGSPFSSSGR